MEDGALFIVVYTFGNSNFLHQTVHPIYANFRTRYRTCRRAVGLLLMAPGAGAILGGLTLAFVTRFPRPHQLLLFPLAALLHPSYYSLSRETFRFRSSRLFFAGGFQTTFLSSIATLLQVYTDESNGDGSCLCLD